MSAAQPSVPPELVMVAAASAWPPLFPERPGGTPTLRIVPRGPDAATVPADVDLVLIDGRADDAAAADLCRQLRHDAARELPLVVVLADGAAATAASTLRDGADAVVDWAGGPELVAATIEATLRTRRRHGAALERLRQSAVEDQAGLRRDLDALTYAVSHDLRAPLRSIDGFSAALAETLADNLAPAAADQLRRVRTAAGRLMRMIDGLLEISRAGRAAMTCQATDLCAVIQAAARTVGRRYTHTPAVTLPAAIEAAVDRDLAQRLFEHALDNAWKFTARAAEPAIVVEAVERPDGTEYVISDNGAGFDMGYVDKLFRPFQRLHPAGDYAGVGIGLAVVQRIVQRHGGRVTIESAPAAGTMLRFTLAPPPGSGSSACGGGAS